MPNWTRNYLTLHGDDDKVKAVVDAFKTHHPSVPSKAYDGTVIHRPTTASKEEGTYGYLNEETGAFRTNQKEEFDSLPEGWVVEMTEAHDQFPDFNKVIPQPDNIFRGNLGEKERKMCIEQGRPNWYDWNTANWGTKWNSSDCEVGETYFEFSTAWCGVPNIIQKMSELHPEVTFDYRTEHEDGGGEWMEMKAGEHV